MAVIGVNLRPTYEPREKQKDRTFTEKALDNVFKAAQIAQAGYGIYSNYKELAIKRDTLEAAQARNTQEYEMKFFDDFEKNPRTRGIIDGYDAADNIVALTEDGSLDQLQYGAAMLSAVRSAVGTGQLSDFEIKQFEPDPSIRARISRALKSSLSGKARRQDVDAFRRLADIIKRSKIKKMESWAGAFADTRGRRIGNMNYIVNEVLKPRSLLQGAGQAAPLSFKKNVQMEGKSLKNETRARINLNLPTAGSPQEKDAVTQFQQGKMDPRITNERINAAISKAKQANPDATLTRGQAIIMLQRSIQALKEKQSRKDAGERFDSRAPARNDARETLKDLNRGP